MKKLLLMLIPAAILAAIIISAGCVSVNDEFIGSWYCDNDEFAANIEVTDQKIGIFSYVTKEGQNGDGLDFSTTDFKWYPEGNGVYKITLDNGEEFICVMDKSGMSFTSDGYTYTKRLSALSAAA